MTLEITHPAEEKPADTLPTGFGELVAEASRQLDICNACRYCEGLCAVFPALERRTVLGEGDISQLANLCHDCRACYDACMYDPPHEFAIDVPRALSAVRFADYRRYVWPPRVPQALSGWSGVALGGLASTVIVLVLAVLHAGWSGLVAPRTHATSPYALIPSWELIVLMLAAALYSVIVMGLAGRAYWRAIGGSYVEGQAGWISLHAIVAALWYAATLRYLRGSGAECYYPEDDVPSRSRRDLHGLVAYGFGLCVVSTLAAGVEQHLAGIAPPYPWLSVPVISGTIGGIGLVIGSLGLLGLKARSSPVTTFAQMTIKDYGLLVSLTLLGVTGLATLLTRDTTAFGLVLLIHLGVIVEAFAMAPYSKFVHLLFRFEALVRDNLEIAARGRA